MLFPRIADVVVYDDDDWRGREVLLETKDEETMVFSCGVTQRKLCVYIPFGFPFP